MRAPALITEVLDDLVRMGITQPWRWRFWAAALLVHAWYLVALALEPGPRPFLSAVLGPLPFLLAARIASSWYRAKARRARARRRTEGMIIA